MEYIDLMNLVNDKEYAEKARLRRIAWHKKDHETADYQRWLKEYNEARERKGLAAFIQPQ